MKMNLNQTKLVGLTMELDLKTREYKKLCAKLEKLKKGNIDENALELLGLKELFQKNHNEIVEINQQIKELKNDEILREKQLSEPYDSSTLFKRTNDITIKHEEANVTIIKNKENIFIRILEKIKKILNKK